MDADLGIQGYGTSTPGVGGVLKASADDFVVEEVSNPPPASEEGRFAIARIRVRDWETNRLVRQMARSLRMSRRRIGFAGTKDKRAVTTRLFSFEGVTPERVGSLAIKDLEVLDLYTSMKPLEIGDLLGNQFRIVVRDLAVRADVAAVSIEETSRELRVLGGFPNFFGVQRFGSVRPITHLVGRHIVRGEFQAAVETYVANPLAGEDPESYEVRRALAASGDVRAALRSYPKPYAFERAILDHLNVHPGDYVGALRRLPSNLLMMFVHAYQSFLFNRIVSERLRRGIPLHQPVAGDLVLPAGRDGLPDRGRAVDVTCDNLSKVTARCQAGKAWVSVVLFGSGSEFSGGEPGQIEQEIVAREGIRPLDFVIPDLPHVSSKGTRREALASVRSLETSVAARDLKIGFELNRGCYATSLLREFMKA